MLAWHLRATRVWEFIPLAAEAGFLACPQSLTGVSSLGNCVNAHPLGAAFVSSAAGADVFAECVPQKGESILYRYPFLRWQPETNFPCSEPPLKLRVSGEAMSTLQSYAMARKQCGRSTVVASTSPLYRRAAYTYLHSVAPNVWKLASSNDFVPPAGWLTFSSVAAQSLPSQGTRLFGTFPFGNSSRALGIFSGRGHDQWRKPTYEPYSGEGIYRGSISLVGIASFDMDANWSVLSQTFRKWTPDRWSGGLMGLSVGILRSTNRTLLMGASRSGHVFFMSTAPPGDTPRNPQPVFETASQMLYEAPIIGAIPIGYPRGVTSSYSDVIIGEKMVCTLPLS